MILPNHFYCTRYKTNLSIFKLTTYFANQKNITAIFYDIM